MKNDVIFVAGASGLVGSAVLKLLESEGYTNVCKPSSSELDLTNQADVFNFFKQNLPRVVVLAAAKVGGIKQQTKNSVDFLEKNLLIVVNVVSAANSFNVEKLIFISSANIYPINSTVPIKEDNLLNGRFDSSTESYSLAKLVGLKLVEAYRSQYGKNFITLIPCNLYGLYDSLENDKSHVIPSLIKKLHQAKKDDLKEVVIWGTGKAKREFLFVEDFAKMLFYFIERDINEAYINVGSGEEYSISELSLIIASVVGYIGKIHFDNVNPDGIDRKLLDITKQKRYGLGPTTNLIDGIKKTYQWYLSLQDDLRKET